MLFILLFLIAFTTKEQHTLAKTLSTSFQNETKRIWNLEGEDQISFIAIGDWGSQAVPDGRHQLEVAGAMARWCEAHPCHFVLSTGDNIYDDGVTSAADPQFETTWRAVYSAPSLASLAWVLTVGNHDHHTAGGAWFQVQYGRTEPRWTMPGLAYSLEVAAGNTSLKLVSLDTVSIDEDRNCAGCMLELLRAELEAAAAGAWKVVFGHYPLHSGGGYGGYDTIRESVGPLLERGGADFYLSGHDHNQQHWVARETRETRGTRGTEHVTAGAGGKDAYGPEAEHVLENEELGMRLEHFQEGNGFVYFTVREEEVRLQFVNTYDTVVYQSVRQKMRAH